MEPLETMAEHTQSFASLKFWGRTHFEPVMASADPLSDPLPSIASGRTEDLRNKELHDKPLNFMPYN